MLPNSTQNQKISQYLLSILSPIVLKTKEYLKYTKEYLNICYQY